METTQERLAAIWQRYRESTLRRLEVIDTATKSLQSSRLESDLRQKAAGEAHNLAGSLGTFGLHRGARVARELQLVFGGEAATSPADVPRLQELLQELRDIVEDPLPNIVCSGDWAFSGRKLLIVDADVENTTHLASQAVRRGFLVVTATSLEDAQKILAQGVNDVMILEIVVGKEKSGIDFLREMAALYPELTVIVLTQSFDFMDRVEVARWGGRGFLEKPLSPNDVLDFTFEVLRHKQRPNTRVLLVDDDATFLKALTELLEADGLDAHAIQNPKQFWRALEMIAPDLVVLDIEMPEINGFELCRTMRNDARWATVPVLFLTTRTDQVSLLQGFDSGADDFVHKDAGAIEMRARIRVRLERSAAQASDLRRDPLTGLLNRREATNEISRLLSLAARQDNHLAVTVLDLDHFKQVNDKYGHAAGDEVLRRLAARMLAFFRNEDVVARWGGEEFLVATYGMDSQQASQRINRLLELFRAERFDFAGPDFSVSFSAGIADFPTERTLEAAVAQADVGLYQAKESGRSRVTSAAAGRRS